MSSPTVISYGGGLDSFAMLLLAIEQNRKPDAVAFIDVADGSPLGDGDDPGEWPGTYRHMREVVIPMCAQHDIEFVWITSKEFPVRDARSLIAWLEARKQIPVAGPNRICTVVAKVERFEKWLDTRWPDQEVEVSIGFEAGEEKRADKDPNAGAKRKLKPGRAYRTNRFPLMEQGYCRCRCEALVRSMGLPIPRKSACVFCPYGSIRDFKAFHRELPEHFARAAALETNKPPTSSGKKLSIKGYRTIKDKAGNAIGYKSTPLPEYVKGTERAPRPNPCRVCGAERKATKATGCGYLEDAA